jgi:ribosomal protein S18 acetylase RimI-like enzyme
LIGAGGINFTPDGTQARLSWDFLHPDFQRQGMGKKLTLHRIREIKKNPAIRSISVRTSQLAYAFYQKLGFELQKIVKDFWAEGFDLYEMKLDLDE